MFVIAAAHQRKRFANCNRRPIESFLHAHSARERPQSAAVYQRYGDVKGERGARQPTFQCTNSEFLEQGGAS